MVSYLIHSQINILQPQDAWLGFSPLLPFSLGGINQTYFHFFTLIFFVRIILLLGVLPEEIPSPYS